MKFTAQQLQLIQSTNPKVIFELKGLEVLAIFALGQMHNKIVRMTDNFFGNTRVGLFRIDELNGKSDLDFSMENADAWTDVTIDTITITLTTPNERGGVNTSKFHKLTHIESIALLEK